eukprot:COSAG01_NODE_4110_length_5339_cov_15.720802_2_plen_123_part_00
MLLRGAPSLAYLAALALSPPLAGHVRGVRGAIRGHIGLVALGAEQPRRALGGRAPALEAQPHELLRGRSGGGGTEHRAPRQACSRQPISHHAPDDFSVRHGWNAGGEEGYTATKTTPSHVLI